MTLGRALWLRRTVSLAICLAAGPALAATVQQITSFGNNPTGIGMYLYTPNNAASHPPLLVGVHACQGKGTDVCGSGTPFAQQADKYGFLLVCPSAVSSNGCWDVHSNAVLTHNGGGDATGIISMVDYLINNKNVDASRVYVAGHSSGGMMTNVLLGSYPDVFQAGAAFAGVPFACFAQGSVDSTGWSSTCANGNVTMTGPQWGNLVRNAYPGFSGKRPRVQLWHGTVDATVNFHNFGEEIKEWTNVLGVSETATTIENNAIQTSWIRTRYADNSKTVQVEAIQETGQPHNLVVDMADAVHFFGLDGSNPVSTGGAAGSSATVGHGGGGAGGHGEGGAAGAATATGGFGGTAGRPGTGGGDGGTVSGSRGGSSGGAAGAGGGGSPGRGGATASGGAAGAQPGTDGGSSSTGGALGADGPGAGETDSGSGCSCDTGLAADGFGVYSVLLAAVLLIRRSGRRSTRRRT